MVRAASTNDGTTRDRRVAASAVIALLLAFSALLAGGAARAAADAPSYDLVGEWATGYESSGVREPANGTYTITAMNMSSGVFSGTAEVLGTGFQLEGTENGSVAQFTLTAGSYVAYDTLHLSVQSGGHVGGSGSFSESGYSESGSPFWAEQTAAKRASATAVTCNYEVSGSDFDCLASVGDASGEAVLDTPTGTVEFVAGSGGFPDGTTCALAPTPDSPGVAECSVVYQPPPEGIPTGTPAPVAARYSGDADLAPSEGGDNALSASPSPAEVEEAELRHAAEALEREFEAAAEGGWEEDWARYATCPAGKAAASEATDALLAGGAAEASSLRSKLLPGGAALLGASGARPSAAAAPRHGAPRHPLDFAVTRRRALKIFRPGRQPTETTLAVFALPKPLPAGSTVGERRVTPGPARRPRHLHERAWLFWENTELGGQLPHASALVAIGVRSGRVLAAEAMEGAPSVNGHVLAFVTRPTHGRIVFARTIKVRLSKKARHRIDVAQALVRKLLGIKKGKHKKASHKAAAHASDATPPPAPTPTTDPYAHSRVIVLGGGTAPLNGETMVQEADTIEKVFKSHGVTVYNDSNVPLTATPTPQVSPGVYDGLPSLGSIISDQHKDDHVNEITIYATGHGSVSTTRDGKLEDAGVLIGSDTGGSDLFRASAMAAIAKANPDVHFNLIVDACHSGAFSELLQGIPNIGSITTSSAANEISWGPGTVEPYDPEKVPSQQTLNFNPGFRPQLGQLILNSAKPPAGAISPFTTGEAKALDDALKAAASGGGSLDDVVQQARTTEPQYDTAAQLGETHPNQGVFVPCTGEGSEESGAKGA